MELLIPGLALVALMVYASTRLKKATARALEAEEIETEHFSISKPAGFINVVSPDGDRLLQAYTKEFAESAPNVRKAEATVRVRSGSTVGSELEVLKSIPGFVSSKWEEGSHGSPCLVRLDQTIDGTVIHRSVKLVEDEGLVYRLQIDVPAGCDDEFTAARREMNDSFEVKRGAN
jgi:hypothetical protein